MVVLDMAPDEMKTARQPGQSWRAGGGDCRQAALLMPFAFTHRKTARPQNRAEKCTPPPVR
jgi:hypothetical protein